MVKIEYHIHKVNIEQNTLLIFESEIDCFDPGNNFINYGYYALPKVATNNFRLKIIYLYYCFMYSLLIVAFTYSVATKSDKIR